MYDAKIVIKHSHFTNLDCG